GTRKLLPRVDEAVELGEPRHGRLWWGCSAAGGDGGERESAHDGAHGVGRNGAPADRCQFQTNVTTAPAGRVYRKDWLAHRTAKVRSCTSVLTTNSAFDPPSAFRKAT